jgi:uncharacterized protein (TIGR02996 family)
MSTHGPDWITFRGRNRMLLSFPLEPYLRGLPARPDFRLTGPEYQRGYMGEWEIRADDTLWLTGLKTRPDDDGPDPGLRLVFPAAPGPVAATWVSQPLRSPDGERRYDPRGYASPFARETNLAICDGRLVMVEEVDGRTGRVTGTEFTHHLEGEFGQEEGAFLRAIRSAPDDSAPRLVYADWLDERHDPRGAVVRLIERLRGLAPEVAARERAAHPDLIRTGTSPWPWGHIIAYHPASGELGPVQTGA